MENNGAFTGGGCLGSTWKGLRPFFSSFGGGPIPRSCSIRNGTRHPRERLSQMAWQRSKIEFPEYSLISTSLKKNTKTPPIA